MEMVSQLVGEYSSSILTNRMALRSHPILYRRLIFDQFTFPSAFQTGLRRGGDFEVASQKSVHKGTSYHNSRLHRLIRSL